MNTLKTQHNFLRVTQKHFKRKCWWTRLIPDQPNDSFSLKKQAGLKWMTNKLPSFNKTTAAPLCKILHSCSVAHSRGTAILWGSIYSSTYYSCVKTKKGKAGIECACSAEPSPGQIKVKKDLTAGRAEGENSRKKRRRDEGRLSLSADR